MDDKEEHKELKEEEPKHRYTEESDFDIPPFLESLYNSTHMQWQLQA